MRLEASTDTAKIDAAGSIVFFILPGHPNGFAVRMASQQQDENPTASSASLTFAKNGNDRDKIRAVPTPDLIRQHDAPFGVGVLILLSRFLYHVVDDRPCSWLDRCLPRPLLRFLVTARFCELGRRNPRIP